MAERAEEIFSELAQICEQYKAEVPSDRRAWPESVKSRIFELKSLGINYGKIAERSGIAIQTIYSWKKPSAAAFLPVTVKESIPPTVTVGKRPKIRREKKSLTVTVVTPMGYRIEGLDAKSAADFVARLGAP